LAASVVSLQSECRGEDVALEHFPKSGHRFSEENAIKSIRLERFPIQRNREAL